MFLKSEYNLAIMYDVDICGNPPIVCRSATTTIQVFGGISLAGNTHDDIAFDNELASERSETSQRSHGVRTRRETSQRNTSSNGAPRLKSKHFSIRRLSLICAGGVLGAACIGMLIVRGAIKKDHLAAVDDYNANNFVTVEKDSYGYNHILGCVDGQSFDYTDDGTYCSGVSINGVPIGGLTYEEARSLLLDMISDELLSINMSVVVDNVSLLLTSSSFNITTDLDEVLHEAFTIGRESETDFYANYQERMRVASEGVDLKYTLTLDESSVVQRVTTLASSIDKAAVEPYVTLKNLTGGGKPGYGTGGSTHDVYDSETIYAPNGDAIADIIYHYGANGHVLNKEPMWESIIAAFYAGDYTAKIEASLEEVAPESTPDVLMASVKKLASFSTEFKSSSSFRARNVQKANALLNCIVMNPGEELSYNEILGPRTEAGGWLQAPGISGGREYVDSPGGGICQISSTLYNALLLLGDDMEIVSRRHHSIPGSYVDMGLDATVSTGGPDLVWSPATDSPLYLLTYTDMDKRIAYVYIFGEIPEDGSTYRVWSETVSVTEPPEPIKVAEPLWPKGYSKTVITARNGYTVNVYRQKFDADGNPVGDPVRLYQDIYSSVRGEIHYGTGDASLPKP